MNEECLGHPGLPLPVVICSLFIALHQLHDAVDVFVLGQGLSEQLSLLELDAFDFVGDRILVVVEELALLVR